MKPKSAADDSAKRVTIKIFGVGNAGLNSFLTASREEPARLYVNDFSHRGSGNVEQIITSFRGGASYPLAGRDELVDRIPALKQKYPTYAAFGASKVEDIFSRSDLRQAELREAHTFASLIMGYSGYSSGKIVGGRLPTQAQLAPIYAILPGDFDGDGKTDLLVGGNLYGVLPILGRYDASYGLMLRGNGLGSFVPVDMEQSGFVVDGQIRDIKKLRGPNGLQFIAVARNNDRLLLFRVSSPTAGGSGATQRARDGTGAQAAPRPPQPAAPGAQNTSSRPQRRP